MEEQKAFQVVAIVIAIIIATFFIFYFIFYFAVDMSFKTGEILLAFIIFLFFIALDYFSFLSRKLTLDKEKIGHFPDRRIWGLGVIFGITFLLLPFLKNIVSVETHSEPWDLILLLGKVVFFLVLFGFILIAIVKIVKED